MTVIRALMFATTLAVGTLSSAAHADEPDEIALTRKVIETQRQAIVAENLNLDEAQAEVFWPLYDEYQGQMRTVSDQYIAIVKQYAEAWPEGVDDEIAEGLMKDWLAMETDRIKTQRKYLKRFGKILPTAQVLRFFQIENKLTTIIRADVAMQIPLTES